jgi:D-amino-acid oxidase
MDCAVVGAGVSGLSCGIRLLEHGHSVTILSEFLSPNTVSDTAAAWWYPFLAEPINKTNRWSAETFDELVRLMNEENVECITMRKGREYLKEEEEAPGWSVDIPHFRILKNDEIVNGYSYGWEIEAPVIEMHIYMPWLMSRFENLGGKIEITKLEDLGSISADVIVNCCGLGATELCNDERVIPVRGQVIYIKQDPGFGRFDQKPDSLTYTIPRRDVTVLGGTAQVGDWTMETREQDTEIILEKCESLWPELDRSNIVGLGVGLRPSRDEVRLEAEIKNQQLIIHNYGHGGAGVTLSWGCADEVVKLIQLNMMT